VTERDKGRERARREVDSARGQDLNTRGGALDQAERIAAGTEELKGIITHVESALNQLENAREHMTMAIAELRGQTTVIKERVFWLIGELDQLRPALDKLRVQLKALK
jgi:chromosome segregation ATPase